MTEQEIVKYLKENKTKGVAFVFMPKEVKEWACDNSRYIIYYNKFGWDDYSSSIEIYKPTDVIALPQDYKQEIEQQSGWVEFEIKSGVFDYDDRVFDWWDWGCFLNYCKGCNTDDITTFGGWQYENDDSYSWYTQPMTLSPHDSLVSGYSDDDKPLIPIKIRFWREAK